MRTGSVCAAHPELGGLRTNSYACAGCKKEACKARRSTPRGAAQNAATARKYADKLKAIVFGHYGNCCTKCGFNNPDALTVEHTEQNGAEHRRKIGGGGRRIHKWLIDHDFPAGFTLLCQNCNTIAYKNHLRSVRP